MTTGHKAILLMTITLAATGLLVRAARSNTPSPASQPGGAGDQPASQPAGSTPATQPDAAAPASQPAEPLVEIKTTMGDIRLKLWADLAPKTVENFLAYADSGFFDGTIFHRVIPNFMIQGGGFTPDMRQKPTQAPIRNEASAKARNRRGTIAMARTSDVHSATAQFFINHGDNDFLDHRDETSRGFGYAAFGEVVSGMDVVDRIAQVQTRSVGPFDDVPTKPVVINSIRRVDQASTQPK